MTGKSSARREGVDTTAVDVLKGKAEAGARRKVVPTKASMPTELVLKSKSKLYGRAGAEYQVRRMGRAGPTETSSRARALKACKGKKGCEFASCVKDALGRVPPSLKVACPSV